VPAVKPATAKPATADIQALLGTDQPARWWARPSLWIGLAVLAAAAGGIYFWQAQKESNAAPVYVTEPCARATSRSPWRPTARSCRRAW